MEELSQRLTSEVMEQWTREERQALLEGGDALSVYGVRLEEGKIFQLRNHKSFEIDQNSAPTLAEIRLKLAEREDSAGVESGATTWIANGISIQEAL